MVSLARIASLHAALLLAGAGAMAVTGYGAPVSLLAGGAVMGLNLWLLRVVTGQMVRRGSVAGGPRAGLAVGALMCKFGLLLGVVALLLSRLALEGASFVVGVTLLLAACVIEAVWHGASPARGAAQGGTRLYVG